MTTWFDAVMSEARREEMLTPREHELTRYTLGELSPERERELWTLADADPELGSALAAHRPLSPERCRAIARAAAAAFAERSAAPPERRPSRRARALAVLGPLALAAAVLLSLWTSREDRAPELVALADYRLEVRGSVSALRGSPLPSPTPELGNPVLRWQGRAGGAPSPELVLRPRASLPESPDCALFASTGTAPPRRWPHRVERSASGAVLLRVDEPEGLPDGARLIVVLRASGAPEPGVDQVLAHESGPGWRRWLVDVERPAEVSPQR
jgi:hypothetical protein